MKPALEHLPLERDHSFVVKTFAYHHYPTPWHYHPEFELVLVTESTGKRFIGDNVSAFAPGNLAFIGPNIPHTYKNDDQYYNPGSALQARSIVVHFTEASLGHDFLQLPEARSLRVLLNRARQGLDVTGNTNRSVASKMTRLVDATGLKRWLCLADILYELMESVHLKLITQTAQMGYNEKESKRFCRVFDWITANFQKAINLREAAAVAEMNEQAFSRYFSLRTRKTFTGFVQELRLQKAARLLVENDLSITAVCYESGYNNISNFNRQFLNYYQMNPMRYRKTFLCKG